jgi:putative ABC transport system permease protein
MMLDALLRDFRSTRRLLAGRPAWTAAAILCLAIATGANTAAFTIVNGLLLRPLPFDQPHELVMVALREPAQSGPRPFALREYREIADRSGGTIQLLARTFFPLSLVADDGARMAQAELVNGNYFETLQITPFLGRFFDRGVDPRGGTPLAVLSHRLWRLRFGGNPAIIGQPVRVNGRSVIVAGVAPPGFVGAMQLVAADLWLPAAIYPDLAGSTDAENTPMFGVMGRLAADVTVNDAQVRLTPIVAALSRAHTGGAPLAVIVTPATGFGVPIAVQGTVLTLSGFLYAMMVLLMVVAAANVAALVLARGAGRTREIAIRLSLGASRLHIARQLLIESLALALAGCTAGTLVAIWLTQVLVAHLTTPFQYVSYAIDVHPDARVFAYSAVATALTAVLCGVAPIRYAARVDVVEVMKQSTKSGFRGSRRTLNAMVAMQFAVSTTLLVGAGLLVRAYVNAVSTRPAFNASGLITATLDLDQVRLDRTAGTRVYQTVMVRLSALPGVSGVGLTRDLPLRSGRTVTVAPDADFQTARTAERAAAALTVVSSRYFQTLGLRILEGRSFDDGEPARPRVAVVNDAMARRLWPDATPLGRTFRVNETDAEPIEVIGVVGNILEAADRQRSQPAFYQPFPHEYAAGMTVVMRVQTDPGSMFEDVRRTIRDVNRDLSIVDLRTMEDVVGNVAEQRRVPAAAIAIVGMLGLLLSAVGLYGVVAYGVRERARELGIRLALGARPADIRKLVLRQGFRIVAIGVATGGVGAFVFTQIMRSRLFGSGAFDFVTLLTVSAVLVTTAFAALYIPARWASALEPAHTLRSD